MKKENCINPTHLVLYAKKNGIKGVTFSITNKYFKARKNIINNRKNNEKRKHLFQLL